jgi:hypothetical protein
MCRIAKIVLCSLAVSMMASADEGCLILKDASNGDRVVGPAMSGPQVGIPQGHTLKVVLQGIRRGKGMAAGATVAIKVAQGNHEPIAVVEGVLDGNGYGEFLVLVADTWPQEVYQVRADISATGPGGRTTMIGLTAPVRVIEGEPGAEVPEGLPLLLLLLGTGAIALRQRRVVPAIR